jgi:hypothetical protein
VEQREHVEVHPDRARLLARTPGLHGLDEQERGVGRHRLATPRQDPDRRGGAPAVNDPREDVASRAGLVDAAARGEADAGAAPAGVTADGGLGPARPGFMLAGSASRPRSRLSPMAAHSPPARKAATRRMTWGFA